MRYVDHDAVAARAAAVRCREAAHAYERTAAWLEVTPGAVRWWGCERDEVVRRAGQLGDDLRREAGALRTSADLLEAAARAAERREEELVAAAARAAAAAAVCRPTGGGPSVAATPRRAPRGDRIGGPR